MTIKTFLDRKLARLIIEPVIRRLGTALAVYLASKGVPDDQLNQLLAAMGVILGVAFDLAFAALANKKAENVGMRKALDIIHGENLDASFERRN